jgi:hypothetical protein
LKRHGAWTVQSQAWDATVVIKAGRVCAMESNTILLQLFHTIQRRRAAVLRSGPGGSGIDVIIVFKQVGGVAAGQTRAPECCHPGAIEEEVGEILLRIGAVLVDARAMAVEEAPRPSVAVEENLE